MAEKLHVAITAASSFTGYWILRALIERDWKVSALYSSKVSTYKGTRGHRVRDLKGKVNQHFSIRAENGSMVQWIREHQPQIWIHHHHITKDFWTKHYDFKHAKKVGVDPLPSIVAALAEAGCRGVVYSGSYLEPEGHSRASLPYIESKAMVREQLKRLCKKWGLPLSMIFIPNPVGPLDNEFRLIPSLVTSVRRKKDLKILNPDTIVDQYPVKDLANLYAAVAFQLWKGSTVVARPSGWVGSVSDWISKVRQELLQKELQLPVSSDQDRNVEIQDKINWKPIWKEMAKDFT